ncbi:alpha/beta hydrolase [Streptomyces sp. SID9944]|nr:alpha/beta hydrolase [Streptomyces sp. SID9944]
MKTSVHFPSSGLRLAGILFTPDGHTGERLPAVVVSHPFTGVKEQTASVYAERLEDARSGGYPYLMQEGYDYYRTERGRHPRSTNLFVTRSLDLLVQYDSYAMIRMISPRPLLMIAGTAADTARFSGEAIERAAQPKELLWIDGATHMDLYDRDRYVTPAVTRLGEFFAEHLVA